jgi:hypothetical protein
MDLVRGQILSKCFAYENARHLHAFCGLELELMNLYQRRGSDRNHILDRCKIKIRTILAGIFEFCLESLILIANDKLKPNSYCQW